MTKSKYGEKEMTRTELILYNDLQLKRSITEHYQSMASYYTQQLYSAKLKLHNEVGKRSDLPKQAYITRISNVHYPPTLKIDRVDKDTIEKIVSLNMINDDTEDSE